MCVPVHAFSSTVLKVLLIASAMVRITDYVVQGHRFNIFEEAGCWPAMVMVPWAYPLVVCVPLVIGLFNLSYGSKHSLLNATLSH